MCFSEMTPPRALYSVRLLLAPTTKPGVSSYMDVYFQILPESASAAWSDHNNKHDAKGQLISSILL